MADPVFPVSGNFTFSSGYGLRDLNGQLKFHDGVDIAAIQGSPIYSISGGTVIYNGTAAGYGDVIVIKDNNTGFAWLYAHVESGSTSGFQKGDEVSAGDVIANVGNTGVGTGEHLHIEKLSESGANAIENNTSTTSLGISHGAAKVNESPYRMDPKGDLEQAYNGNTQSNGGQSNTGQSNTGDFDTENSFTNIYPTYNPEADNPSSQGVWDNIRNNVEGVINWMFGKKSDDTTADKSKVLDQQVTDNSGSGVGDGHDAIHIETPNITAVDTNIFSSIAGIIGGAIGSIVSGIEAVGSAIGSAIGGFFGFIGDLFGGGNAPDSASGGGFSTAAPVIIDLNGDGANLSSLHESSVFFDIDGDGYLEKTAWAGKEDGLLVVDLFKDGKVDFAEEVNFKLWDSSAKTDMQALRNIFDTNHNGQLDSGDARFDEFKIWQDVNQNGRVDEGELKTLAEWGITSIGLDSKIPVNDNDGKNVNGNIIYGDTAIERNGTTGGRAYDTALAYSIGGIKFTGNGNEFSINYEDGREVKVYQAPDETPLNIDAASKNADVVIGTSGADHISNSSTKDIIIDGGSGNDILEGGAGDDWLYGGTGSDSLRGGAGNDILFIDSSDNLNNIDGGAGEDIAVITSADSMSINITDHNIEKIFGNNGNDNFMASGNIAVKMDGGAGEDILTGAGGDDHLEGGAGNDILNGKGGNNFLVGGAGSDRFIIENNPGTTTQINGFEASNKAEKIDLSAFNLTQLVIITDSTNTTIQIGNGQFITLANTNISQLDQDNFIFKAGTAPKLTMNIHGGAGSEIIKGTNIDDIIDVGGGSNYVVTGRGNDTVYLNPNALDVIKISREAGKIDTIYGFNNYSLTQFTYWMGNFTGDTKTGAGNITSGTPELWSEKTKQTSFNNAKFDLTEFGYFKDISSVYTYTQGKDTIINLGEGQQIILKDFVQHNDTKNYLYGRDWVGYGGHSGANFIVDYDITKASVDSSNFIFSRDGSVTGSLIDDTLHGTEFMDILNGSEGNDHIYGYSGTDLLTGGRGDDYLDGGDNNDGIGGNEGDDEIHGGSGNDAMWGDAGNDTIYGEDGIDFLTGGTGSDTLVGGNGDDTYIFAIGDGKDVVIDTGTNTNGDVIKFGVGITIDSLVLTRNGADLIINFKGNNTDQITLKNQYLGGENGVEIFRFSDNTQVPLDSINVAITGTNQNDTIVGTNKDDIIIGGKGDDLLQGAEGNDAYIFNAGDGKDTIDETGKLSNRDVINFGSTIAKSSVTTEKVGNDLLIHFAGNTNDLITVKNQYSNDNSKIETLHFTDGSEINLVNAGANIHAPNVSSNIGGTEFNDNIYGGSGDDVLEGGKGADYIDGGAGNDIISYEHSDSAVTVNLLTNIVSGGDATGDSFINIEGAEGSAFNDALTGNDIGNNLYGRDGDDVIYGNGGNDKLFGGDGIDHIVGGSGDDYIDGGDGADLLEGGIGNDSIFGGAGGDTIYGGDGDDYLSGGTEGDYIDGGNGNDHLSTGFGNDMLIGGSGADIFTISKSAGVEQVIKDFERSVTGEKIDLWAFTQIHSFADLKMSQSGLDTLLDLGNSQILRIKNTLPTQLNADDFTFRQDPKEFVVNSTRAGYQDAPSIASLDNGNFVITWNSTSNQFGNIFDVKGRVFEADGTPQGLEFNVSLNAGANGYVPNLNSHVIGLKNGKFAVVWEVIDNIGPWNGHVQVFDSSGQKVGSQIEFKNGGNALDPTITELSNGNFIVAWGGRGTTAENYDYGAIGQIYTPNGTKVGKEITLNTTSSHDNSNSFQQISMIGLSNGGFVAVWDMAHNVSDSNSIAAIKNKYIQIFDSSGNKVGSETILLEGAFYLDGSQENIASAVIVTSLTNDNIIAVWRNEDDAWPYYNTKITGQVFNSHGDKLGGEFEISAPSGTQTPPKITSLDDGGFIVTWSMYNQAVENDWSEGIYAQRFRADGLKLGEEYHVNDTTQYQQMHPDITQLESGDFVVTWDSDTGTTTYRDDIFAKIYPTEQIVVNHPVYNQTILANNEFALQLPYDTFLDANSQPLSYSATLANGLPLPSWLTFNPATLTFKGTPGNADAGSVGIRITASDGSQKITDSFNINIETPVAVYSNPVSTAELQVNTTFASDQITPSITTLANGGYVVVWANKIGQDLYTISGQRFDSAGNKSGDEFVVVSQAKVSQIYDPIVQSFSNGDFWVSWRDESGVIPANSYNITLNVQRMDSNGNVLGSPFQLKTPSDNEHFDASMTELDNGNIVISWSSFNEASNGRTNTDQDIYSQIFDRNGNSLTAVMAITTDSNLWQIRPQVSSLANGNYVMVYGVNSNVAGQLFDHNGNKIGSEFTSSLGATYPDIAALHNGGFVIVSSDNQFDNIYAQILDSQGNKVSSQILVSTETDFNQLTPHVTVLDNGHFVITWQSSRQDSSSNGVYGQAFDENGNKLGNEFRINDFTKGAQDKIVITSLAGNRFAVAWESKEQDGSGEGIYTKIFTESGYEVIGNKIILEGTDDRDVLYGTKFNDTFTGYDGNDIFVIAKQSGKIDIIRDLKLDYLDGSIVYDKIDLSDFKNIKSFNDLKIVQDPTKDYPHAIISLGDGQQLELKNVNLNSQALTADNFIFYQSFNTAPQIFSGIHDQAAIVNNSISIAIPENAFFDLEGDAISYTATMADGSALPVWLSFDSHTNSFSGTPTNANIGDLDIKLTASDGKKSSSTIFKLDVAGTLLAINADKTIGYVASGAVPIKDFLVTSTSDNMSLTLTLSDKASGTLRAGNFTSQNGLLTISGSSDTINASLLNLSFIPNQGFAGSVQINTLLHDGINHDFTGSMIIHPNSAPVAASDVFFILEDATATTINPLELLANDNDVEDIKPSFNGILTGPQHGTLILGQDGSYIYTPVANFNGVDNFTYKVKDSLGVESTATATINVAAVNDAPVLSASAVVSGVEDVAVVVRPLQASDIEDGVIALTYGNVVFSNVRAGSSVVVNNDGTFTYKAAANWSGADSFAYAVKDSSGTLSAPVTVNVNVAAVNDAPVASNIAATLNEDNKYIVTAADFLVLSGASDVDNDILAIASVSGGVNGVVALDAAGNVTFTPTANFNGAASFAYTISDGHGGVVTKTANLTINAVNDAPTASNIAVAINEDNQYVTSISGLLLAAKAKDADRDALTITSVQAAKYGTVELVGGNVVFTPTANYNGSASFTYTIDDGHGAQLTKLVTLNIAGVNDAPTIKNVLPDKSAKAGTSFTTTISTAAFQDVDSSVLTYSAKLADGSSLPSWLSFNAVTRTFSGSVPYGASSVLDIAVVASDGQLSATQIFHLNIAGNLISGDGTVTGTSGNDLILGGSGADTLIGGSGADQIDGGAGLDTASYAGSTAAVTLNLETNINSGGMAAGDILSHVENITGSKYDDNITGDSGSNVIAGGLGADRIDGGNGADTASYADSTVGVTVNLTTGINTGGTAEGDVLSHVENIIGSKYNDNITGDAGDNIITGGLGADKIDGGAGVDTASYADSASAVTVSLVEGAANKGGRAAGDVLTNIENLEGSAFNDKLTGNAGDNVITGGQGADLLKGGLGHDVFHYDNLSDSNHLSYDTISDFTAWNASAGAGDKIDLVALHIFGIEAFTDLTITQNTTTKETIITANDNAVNGHTGNVGAHTDFELHLKGLINLHQEDFVWG